MSRALGIVAEACAAVIAAEIQASMAVTPIEARAVGRAAVAALRGDGWHITAGPAAPIEQAPETPADHPAPRSTP
ncbi:hypothetical protein [Streptomyces sp. NPDC102487]|uniref:hypothetical protein n=1 Tax=Streptomyces sp. NPDC102487 TaxID=3366182 RepID=UPI0038214C51